MKTPKVKKRVVSKRSRAARRGDDSAPVAKDKSVVEETDYKPWLHGAQNAGISKKRKVKQLTRGQRERHLKGLENADRNASKLEKKVADSKARAKKVKSRAADWEDLNGSVNIVHQAKDGVSAPEAMEEVELDLPSTKTKPTTVPGPDTTPAGPEMPAQEQEAAIDEVT